MACPAVAGIQHRRQRPGRPRRTGDNKRKAKHGPGWHPVDHLGRLITATTLLRSKAQLVIAIPAREIAMTPKGHDRPPENRNLNSIVRINRVFRLKRLCSTDTATSGTGGRETRQLQTYRSDPKTPTRPQLDLRSQDITRRPRLPPCAQRSQALAQALRQKCRKSRHTARSLHAGSDPCDTLAAPPAKEKARRSRGANAPSEDVSITGAVAHGGGGFHHQLDVGGAGHHPQIFDIHGHALVIGHIVAPRHLPKPGHPRLH